MCVGILPCLVAQELNCRVTINKDKIQISNQQIFIEMEKSIKEFVNNRKWTDYKLT
ncbi:MAG: DUF4835 family protein, partial [Bacteroidales bacterium]|nr:DUF4835 family protein [Bacteroidales bacterium]